MRILNTLPLSAYAENCGTLAAVSFPMPVSASSTKHIRILEQRHPNLLPATFESGTSDVRVCSQRRLHTGRYSPKVIVLASGGKVEIG